METIIGSIGNNNLVRQKCENCDNLTGIGDEENIKRFKNRAKLLCPPCGLWESGEKGGFYEKTKEEYKKYLDNFNISNT